MLNIVDITFHANTEYADSRELVKAQHTSLLYLGYCAGRANITVIKHYLRKKECLENFGPYLFFKGNNRFGFFSVKTLQHIKSIQPDIVLVRGLIFPVQVLALRIWLGRKVKILVRHHADHPFRGARKKIQQLADHCIDAYLFTSKVLAETWIQQRIIRKPENIIELPATLTSFSKQDKNASRKLLLLPHSPIYLWVGRLHPIKDPLTVLKAFDLFLVIQPEASLHMVFQSEELIAEIKTAIAASEKLTASVFLHGAQPYEKMPYWYSSADFFISASYSEGGSAAILEAMACGCIPIVSRIPASMQVIAHGLYGLQFAAGNSHELLKRLLDSSEMDTREMSAAVQNHFLKTYSAQAVTDKLMEACMLISGKQ